MTLTREALDRRIEEAKLLAQLAVHPAWKIIASKVEARLEWIGKAIMSTSLSHEGTQQLRYQADVLRWVLDAPHQDTVEKTEKWAEQLAWQEKRDTMRKRMGLPPLHDPSETA